MHVTKFLLIKQNGLRCMWCGKELPYEEIFWHHMKPKAICRYYREKIDNSYENGALLCGKCHEYVHTFPYWSVEYQGIMHEIMQNKK